MEAPWILYGRSLTRTAPGLAPYVNALLERGARVLCACPEEQTAAESRGATAVEASSLGPDDVVADFCDESWNQEGLYQRLPYFSWNRLDELKAHAANGIEGRVLTDVLPEELPAEEYEPFGDWLDRNALFVPSLWQPEPLELSAAGGHPVLFYNSREAAKLSLGSDEKLSSRARPQFQVPLDQFLPALQTVAGFAVIDCAEIDDEAAWIQTIEKSSGVLIAVVERETAFHLAWIAARRRRRAGFLDRPAASIHRFIALGVPYPEETLQIRPDSFRSALSPVTQFLKELRDQTPVSSPPKLSALADQFIDLGSGQTSSKDDSLVTGYRYARDECEAELVQWGGTRFYADNQPYRGLMEHPMQRRLALRFLKAAEAFEEKPSLHMALRQDFLRRFLPYTGFTGRLQQFDTFRQVFADWIPWCEAFVEAFYREDESHCGAFTLVAGYLCYNWLERQDPALLAEVERICIRDMKIGRQSRSAPEPLIHSYVGRGQFEKAEKIVERAYAESSHICNGYCGLARAYLIRDDLDRALECIDRELKAQRFNQRGLVYVIEALLRSGSLNRWDEIVAASGLNPDWDVLNPLVRYQINNLVSNKKTDIEALQLLARAIPQIRPGLAEWVDTVEEDELVSV